MSEYDHFRRREFFVSGGFVMWSFCYGFNRALTPTHTGRETVTRRDFPVFKSEQNYPKSEHFEVLYALESTSYPVIVILSSFP